LSQEDHSVCLMIWAEAPESERQSFEAAAPAASSVGLCVSVDHASRWPWARERPARASISEDATCACSLLSDDADWNAESWAMRPEAREALARTIEVPTRQGPSHLTIQAIWIGDISQEEVSVNPKELVALAAAGRLGTRTRYLVERMN
jgi:hypothetical protein